MKIKVEKQQFYNRILVECETGDCVRDDGMLIYFRNATVQSENLNRDESREMARDLMIAAANLCGTVPDGVAFARAVLDGLEAGQ